MSSQGFGLYHSTFFMFLFFLPYVLLLCICTVFVFYWCLCAGILLGIGAVKPKP